MKQRTILVLDPIEFRGGSKVASEAMFKQLVGENIRIEVLSNDSHSWNLPGVRRRRLLSPHFLRNRESGLFYFLKHFVFFLQLFLLKQKLGNVDLSVGASGPGIDMSLYLLKKITGTPVLQFVHGPVAKSRTIARCLVEADRVIYLESARQSLVGALQRLHSNGDEQRAAILEDEKYQVLENGLARDTWPKASRQDKPVILWAASLLKWKGLDILLDAIRGFDDDRPETHICYLRPKDTRLAVSDVVDDIPGVSWHESPGNLDDIRANASIFISTSQREPFGLSILEALAAGLCVVIPKDGAYWDRVLTDEESCIKYCSGDADDLSQKIHYILENRCDAQRIGERGKEIAARYRAEDVYREVTNTLVNWSPVSNATRLPLCHSHDRGD